MLFLVALLVRCRRRHWPPHLSWWAIGVFCYGSGTALESVITLAGNTPGLNRWWYLAGAILGAWPLATGSVYLVLSKRTADRLTLLSAVPVVVVGAAVLLTPIDSTALSAHRPTGAVIGWSWIRFSTPLINLYAACFLVGGAAWSCVRFWGVAGQLPRVLGTGLIAVGAILPGMGGAMAKTGFVEALYVAELLGLLLIWAGYLCCNRLPASVPTAPSPLPG